MPKKVFIAKSTLVPISAGMKITVSYVSRDIHSNENTTTQFDDEYLVTEVIHKFKWQNLSASNEMSYTNTLRLIPAKVQYRPSRKTPWPRIYGTLNALIDGEPSSDPYPQLDNTGRYKIRLPFIKDTKEAGKGSIWLRLATPFAGDGFGMHFPLHNGTEVVLSFRDGNPDLPVIIAAVFNSSHKNVVMNRNSYLGGVIMTKSGDALVMDDTQGKHRIGISTNNNWKIFQ